MELPRRPSQPPRNAGFDRAQGTFREALAALRNLSNLVRSRKVGPRAILDMVPDVRSACRPLPGAAADVFGVIEPYLEPGALTELRAFVNERGAALARELDAAQDGAMNARQRLHLEQALAELWRDLNGSRALLSLLEASVYEQALATDVVELMLQTYSGPPSAGQVNALIPAYIQGDGAEAQCQQPRTLAALLACGVEQLAERDGGTPQITIAGSREGWSATLRPSAEPRGIPLTVWGYGAVPPAMPCLHAAAQRVGLGCSWDAEGGVLVLQGGN